MEYELIILHLYIQLKNEIETAIKSLNTSIKTIDVLHHATAQRLYRLCLSLQITLEALYLENSNVQKEIERMYPAETGR